MQWIERVFIKPNASGDENKGIELLRFNLENGDYSALLMTAKINNARQGAVADVCDKILKNKTRYMSVQASTGCPWHVVGVIHLLESSLSFSGVLHNGEKIVGTGRVTKLVPAGRGPFATWEASAIDALKLRKAHEVKDWGVENTLKFLESYNGMGYRKRGINSPYLWSYTNKYVKGKYVADGKFDALAVSKQIGCCAVFLGLLDKGVAMPGLTISKPDESPEAPKVIQNDAPWMKWMADREGWSEKTHDKQLGSYWKYTTYTPGQKAQTVRGRAFAWCAMTVNAALFETGYKGNRSAAARSFDKYGNACGFKFGAIISMRHPKGGRHVTFFHHWIDESKKIASCLGGNQADQLKKSVYNLSGNKFGHEEVIGCRWPVR